MAMRTINDQIQPAALLSSGRFQVLILAAVALLGLLFTAPMVVEEIYPDDLTVIQAPVSGKLNWYNTPGWAMQNFGTVTTYKKRITYDFENHGQKGDGLSIRFSDGGHATMYGSVQFNLPTDDKALNALHSNYRGNEVVTKNLIQTVVNKSVYLTGTLMTSKESYSEKRNDLIHYVTDQIQNGVYRTQQKTTWVKDDLTGQSKEVVIAEILHDKDGKIERQEDSVLNQYNIKAYNFAITTMPYDDVIEAQIKQQQGITMSVQTSIAEAKQKDQQALTAEAEGRASIAKAKATQETIKIAEVTKAEQERQVALTQADKEKQAALIQANKEKEVAELAGKQRLAVALLDQQAAEALKQKLILEGEGESAKRKLILAADGALAQKLLAYQTVNSYWADAFAKYKGDIVPRMISGGGAAPGSTNAMQQFMELQNMNAAKQLGVDLSISGSK